MNTVIWTMNCDHCYHLEKCKITITITIHTYHCSIYHVVTTSPISSCSYIYIFYACSCTGHSTTSYQISHTTVKHIDNLLHIWHCIHMHFQSCMCVVHAYMLYFTVTLSQTHSCYPTACIWFTCAILLSHMCFQVLSARIYFQYEHPQHVPLIKTRLRIIFMMYYSIFSLSMLLHWMLLLICTGQLKIGMYLAYNQTLGDKCKMAANLWSISVQWRTVHTWYASCWALVVITINQTETHW